MNKVLMSGCKVVGIVGVGEGVEKGNGGVGVGVGVGVTCILLRSAIVVDAAAVCVVVKITAIEAKIRRVN
ncbi:MAG: hypothetical protein WBV72_13440 [Nitrososphaeraceae archaeon]